MTDWLTPQANAAHAVATDPTRTRLEHRARWHTSADAHAGRVLIRAVRLAPDLETCEAILRGEHVPRSRLHPHWAHAYGIR